MGTLDDSFQQCPKGGTLAPADRDYGTLRPREDSAPIRRSRIGMFFDLFAAVRRKPIQIESLPSPPKI